MIVTEAKAKLVDEMFSDLINIGNEIDKEDDIIQDLRKQFGKDGEGMSVVFEITLRQPTHKKPNPRVIYRGCFTMIDGYPKKIPEPPNPHVRMRTDFMCLRAILRGHRHYTGPNGRMKVKYGFKRAYGEERLFKEVRDDVHFLSDTVLVDKVIPLLEHRIFPIFRKRWKNKWVMQDS